MDEQELADIQQTLKDLWFFIQTVERLWEVGQTLGIDPQKVFEIRSRYGRLSRKYVDNR